MNNQNCTNPLYEIDDSEMRGEANSLLTWLFLIILCVLRIKEKCSVLSYGAGRSTC
jgi:hypothetical protein